MQDEAETLDLGTMGCDRVKGLEVLLNCDGKHCSPPCRRSKSVQLLAVQREGFFMRKSSYLVTREIEPLILRQIKLKISGFSSSPTRTPAPCGVHA